MDFSTFGRRLSDIEAELEFGEFPDETGGVHVSEDIDAINAETFGDVLNPASTELEDYAAQTASLRLDDLEVVGTSTAPDASQIPIPAFDFGFGQPGPTLNQISDQLGSQLWSSSPSGLFNLWGDSNTPKNHQESVFDAAAKGLQQHPAPIGGGGPFSVGEIGRPQAHPLGMDEVSSQSSVPVSQGPFTDLINSKLAPALFEQQPSPSMPPRLPESAISAEDLEMSLLASGSAQHSVEPAMQKTAPQVKADAHHHAHNQNQNQAPQFAPVRGFSPFRRPGGPGPVQMPPAPTAPVMIPGLPPIPPMLMGIWMDVISGKGPLPPGVPPPPAPVVMFARQMMARGIGPPNDMMQRGPPRMMHNSQSEYMRRQATRKVAPGMPSGKTIEDFAFDPFRGFMSMKEREWLVKIQILQCQGTPLDDDFYYTVWREKQLMAGWTPSANKKMVNEADKRMLEEKLRERAERGRTPLKERDSNADDPPKERKSFFAGALGRPVSSTVYNPRHLIDVRAETGDDESAKKSGTQKKLRTLLLRIESAAYLLIECSEYSRKVRDDPRLRDEALVEITSRVTLVMMELFSVEQITKTLQVGKGRTLFRKLISAPYPLDKGQLLSTLMRTVGSFKKGHDELTREIVPCIHFLLSTYSREQLLAFTSELEIDVLKTAVKEKNSVARDLICSVLVWCAQRKASSASPLFLWLRSAEPIEWDGVGWSHCLSLWTSVIHFSYQDAQYLAEWLRLSVDPKAPSCAASLSISLLSSYS